MNSIKNTMKTLLKWIGIFFLCLCVALLILSVVVHFFMQCCTGIKPHNIEATYINTLAAGVKNVYAKKDNFNNLSNSVLIQAKAAPERMVKDTATLQNSYGGLVVVEPTTLTDNGISNTNNAYKIIYYNVPNPDCERLFTTIFPNFEQITVNGLILKKYPNKETFEEINAHKACRQKKNTMIFYGK